MLLAAKSRTYLTFITLLRARTCLRRSLEPKSHHNPRNNNRSRRGGRIRPPREATRAPGEGIQRSSFPRPGPGECVRPYVFSWRLPQFFTIPHRFPETSPAKIEVTYFCVLHPTLAL